VTGRDATGLAGETRALSVMPCRSSLTTCTNSVAVARSNVAPGMSRSITRSVVLVLANAVRSMTASS